VIRFVAIASLISILVLVLYLPSAYPPARFVNQLRTEHELAAQFWGAAAGMRILERTLDLQASARETAPRISAAGVEPSSAVDSAVAAHMAQVNARLFSNEYFRSIDALVALASYRLCVLAEGLLLFLLFGGAVLCDGWVVRIIRSKEFLQHDPEKFAYVCAAILAACATTTALFLPVTVYPEALCATSLAVSVFASRVLANFHRRS
jgi:hypothetical protein